MKKRFKVGSKQSKKSFSATAARTHWRNVVASVMRGGIRL